MRIGHAGVTPELVAEVDRALSAQEVIKASIAVEDRQERAALGEALAEGVDAAPVHDVKNAFHTALETADITNFTWHDLRHTFASWLMMKGASLRPVAELLGHRGLRMVMRYAHLSA